jgi:hypothetical protein
MPDEEPPDCPNYQSDTNQAQQDFQDEAADFERHIEHK